MDLPDNDAASSVVDKVVSGSGGTSSDFIAFDFTDFGICPGMNLDWGSDSSTEGRSSDCTVCTESRALIRVAGL